MEDKGQGFPSDKEIRVRCKLVQAQWSDQERAIRRLRGWGVNIPQRKNQLLKWFKTKPSSDALETQPDYVI